MCLSSTESKKYFDSKINVLFLVPIWSVLARFLTSLLFNEVLSPQDSSSSDPNVGLHSQSKPIFKLQPIHKLRQKILNLKQQGIIYL